MQEFSIIEKVMAENFRDAEYEMPRENLLENIHTEPFPEFHYPLLMEGWAKLAVLLEDLREKGPVQPGWPNYSKIGKEMYHCHLARKWVACRTGNPSRAWFAVHV